MPARVALSQQWKFSNTFIVFVRQGDLCVEKSTYKLLNVYHKSAKKLRTWLYGRFSSSKYLNPWYRWSRPRRRDPQNARFFSRAHIFYNITCILTNSLSESQHFRDNFADLGSYLLPWGRVAYYWPWGASCWRFMAMHVLSWNRAVSRCDSADFQAYFCCKAT